MQNAEIVTLEQGELLKVPVSYQNLQYLQYYCRKNDVKILQTNFEAEPYVVIEMPIKEKDKILHEISKRKFSIEKVEIIGKAYIKRNNEFV